MSVGHTLDDDKILRSGWVSAKAMSIAVAALFCGCITNYNSNSAPLRKATLAVRRRKLLPAT